MEAPHRIQEPALPDGNNISFLDGESGRYMSGDVTVSLLKTPVFFDKLEIISPHNYCTLHLGAEHQTLDEPATDGDVARERAFFVNIRALQNRSSTKQVRLGSLGTQVDKLTYVDRSLRNLDSQTNIPEVACSLFAFGFLLFANNSFSSDKNGPLLLVCLLGLQMCIWQGVILRQATAYDGKSIVRETFRISKRKIILLKSAHASKMTLKLLVKRIRTWSRVSVMMICKRASKISVYHMR